LPIAGSREGGNPLILTAPASSIGFNTTAPTQNSVLINTLPCEVVDVQSHQLTCLPGPMSERVLAEYWQLTSGTYSFPAVETFTQPGMCLGAWCDRDHAPPPFTCFDP